MAREDQFEHFFLLQVCSNLDVKVKLLEMDYSRSKEFLICKQNFFAEVQF